MIDINVTLLIQMANFLILLFLLNLILYRPIRRIIEKRNQVIDDFTTTIDSMTKSAQEAMNTFAQKIREARVQGAANVQMLKDEAHEAESKLIAEKNQEGQARISQVRKQLESEIQETRGKLQAQVQAFSLAVAEKILGRSIS
jgi:F-type H+-transporting ATPase subunit b